MWCLGIQGASGTSSSLAFMRTSSIKLNSKVSLSLSNPTPMKLCARRGRLGLLVRESGKREDFEKWVVRVAAEGQVGENFSSSTGTENPIEIEPEETATAKVVVKTPTKPRLVLKFIWLEKNIGLGLDQVIPGHGTIPLSPYYFWPRKDAWEELRSKLESKPWISQKRMIILLNQATDIINLWQQSGGNL
ncbi:hypothetical protein AMTRI_Chr04g187970 [Amborella trichopoda]|uniref:30S ribosomal protein 3, chloroplastic n=1 Tax=Amborella trichopoda TaxID=13333 RepID=W1NF06_AMBTC|nr:30S ribosomal protein 3, chloroplastic [Amborella trichopoda]ERM94051.1 hypothetical protein AMTR_s00010p00055110 [Amborella trichopoda]|eukprot:XP_006826814.1 30S ribosomal protein 3, chloroplastic [Amborella trichopoda]